MNNTYRASRGSRVTLMVLGRVVQILCMAAVVYACLQLPPLWATIKGWQNGPATTEELYASILRVALPGWLGLSLFVYCELSLRHASCINRKLQENPTEPWLAHPGWQTALLRTTDPLPWRVLAFVLLSVGLIGIPLAGVFTSSYVILGICLAMALSMASFAIDRIRNKDWRSAELKLVTFPASIGSTCIAMFTIRRDFSADTIFAATLQCTYLLPHSSSDESDNTRRIFWSKTIEVSNTHSQQEGITQLPLQFAIPNDCPESMIVPTGRESMRDVRWEVMVQRKDAAYSGIASFRLPVFRTEKSSVTSELCPEIVREFTPTYQASRLLKEVRFCEVQTGQDGLTMTFRLRDPKILKAALYLSSFCIASIVAILFVVPNLLVQIFLCFLPTMLLLAIAVNVGEYWLWRGKIVRDRDTLVIDCGIPFIHPAIQCLANGDVKLSCEMAFQSQTQVDESWNLVIIAGEEKRLLFRQMGSQGEVETVQRWLADRLGIGVLETDKPNAFRAAVSRTEPPLRHKRPGSKKRGKR